MIIVTGGAGFIGSNLVHALNRCGHSDILVVDNLTKGEKYRNLLGAAIDDYLDKDVFLEQLKKGEFSTKPIKAIFHQGACSDTTEWDGRYMMENNYEYSKTLFWFCNQYKIPFIYASSAAVYGVNREFKEHPANESPLNVYGFSKFQFDQYIRERLPKVETQAVGLRYFNVYGPREAHKGSMASVAFHLNNQLLEDGKLRLFEGCDGYNDGEQRRDFVYVDDAVSINLWFLENPNVKGIFNVGTGKSQTFNDVANSIINYHARGNVDYIPFPTHLRGCYQSYTQADLSTLRSVGCSHSFRTVEKGVAEYIDWLSNS